MKDIILKAWIFLAVAICFEIVGTSLLKASNGFDRYWFGAAAISAYGVSFYFLSFALTKIPVGVAYAIWSGFGIAAISLIGWLIFRQSLSAPQVGFIALILIGAIGLNLTTGHAFANEASGALGK